MCDKRSWILFLIKIYQSIFNYEFVIDCCTVVYSNWQWKIWIRIGHINGIKQKIVSFCGSTGFLNSLIQTVNDKQKKEIFIIRIVYIKCLLTFSILIPYTIFVLLISTQCKYSCCFMCLFSSCDCPGLRLSEIPLSHFYIIRRRDRRLFLELDRKKLMSVLSRTLSHSEIWVKWLRKNWTSAIPCQFYISPKIT